MIISQDNMSALLVILESLVSTLVLLVPLERIVGRIVPAETEEIVTMLQVTLRFKFIVKVFLLCEAKLHVFNIIDKYGGLKY